ncbi:MAG: F0F1 ATP synthase subunit delta [Legionella sp.]|nr:F0F1 ATP synthase subunit delta [Legionella sp.]
MSEMKTLARPYANAIFEHALMQNDLEKWSQILSAVALVVEDKQSIQFLTNPAVSPTQQVTFLLEVLKSTLPFFTESASLTDALQNLLDLLVKNKRLFLLSDIRDVFEGSRAAHERKQQVKVKSFSPLSEEQQTRLKTALARRLDREITLEVTVDPSILGGMIIQANDFVIDGSVRGKLQRLSVSLTA